MGINGIKFPQRETAEAKKKNPGKPWLNSDKELKDLSLLADGFGVHTKACQDPDRDPDRLFFEASSIALLNRK
jgi:hypothetical protein